MDVTVIIPTYNRLWCLPKAVQSCLGTACKTEIIVVDDGSTDGTWEWLLQQPFIRHFYQPNQGQTYAINLGVQHASGKYIRFLDSDDFLNEGIIDKQFKKAEETNSDLIYSRVDNLDFETKRVTTFPDLEPWKDFLEIQLSNKYGSHFLGMLFRTSWVKTLPRRPDFAFREDRMFLLEYGLLNPKIELVEGCAGYWVQHHQQMQGNYTGLKAQVTNWQHLNIYKKILSKLQLESRLTNERKNAACSVLWPLAHWIAKDNIAEAEQVVDWILELDPGFVIPERGTLGTLYKRLGFKHTAYLLRVRRFVKYGWK